MAKYFFFDGEAAEAFSAEGNRQEVRKAVRDILGWPAYSSSAFVTSPRVPYVFQVERTTGS
jgi:hypothetical protein